MARRYDIAIVGAGMAGASLATALAAKMRVLLVEAEDQPGYHATGRSAAFWHESYGGAGVQPLTTASGPFLREQGLLSARGAITIARAGEAAALARFVDTFAAQRVRIELVDRSMIEARIPGLRAEWIAAASEPDCADIDVAAQHQLYLAGARREGTELWCRARLVAAQRQASGWRLTFADGCEAVCGVLVNAAGAWADAIAAMAGVRPIGIAPLRRTVVQLRTSPPPPADLPLVLALDESFYFKPEAGRLWVSPHDETPSAPCDAAPEELDVATAIERFSEVTDWQIEALERKWAGLRSFAPDRLPVYGFDLREPAFFWFAGQGGFGIQTAPAAADLAARLVLGEAGGPVDPARYSPKRFY